MGQGIRIQIRHAKAELPWFLQNLLMRLLLTYVISKLHVFDILDTSTRYLTYTL